MNNIQQINEHMAEMAKERAKEAAENFKNTQLTPEEQEKFNEIQKRNETVVKEVHSDGTSSFVPVSEFASDVEQQIIKIGNASGEMVAKGIHVGDVVKTAADKKREEKDRALDAFRKMAVMQGEAASDGGQISDDMIVEINDEAIKAVMDIMQVQRLNSNDISKFFRKMSLKEIAEKLPARFVNMYLTDAEVTANNFKAKDRIIQTLVYLSITGPEMDYLNEYIDNQNKMMLLAHRIIQINLDMTEVLKSKEKLSEIIAQAKEISEPDVTSIWAKYIKGDPMAIHNLFAQQAVTMQIMEKSYAEIREEYQDDLDCCKMLDEQIAECHHKYETYQSVTDLDTMRMLWMILTTRLTKDNRGGYKNLTREALNAVDRIRRAKQNVLFPVYNPTLVKNPDAIYKLYMEQYPGMIENYNTAVDEILKKNAASEHPEDTKGIIPVHIEGYDDATVFHYFSLLLLILYGRIMKKFSDTDVNKYGAIECDCYFHMYCKLGTDVYLMTKIWSLCKDFVEYAIKTWPAPKGVIKVVKKDE